MTTQPLISDILSSHGPSFGVTPRAIQGAYADFVQKGIACAREHDKGQLFAEAETGTGKTLGYLVAALMDSATHGSRAIVATHTKALQRQIIRREADGTLSPDCDMAKALAIVEAQTGRRLTAALRMGRSNFVDSDLAAEVIRAKLDKITQDSASDYTPSDIDALERMLDWVEANPGMEWRDFLEGEGLDALPCELDATDIGISDATDREGESYLQYKKHVDDSRDADILVTNHSMLVVNAMRSGSILHDGSRPIGVLVVDECDRLESAASSATSDLLPLGRLRASAVKWNALHEDDRGAALIDAIGHLSGLMADLYKDYATAARKTETIAFWDALTSSARTNMLRLMSAVYQSSKPIAAMRPIAGAVDADALKGLKDYLSEFAGLYAEMKSKEATQNVLALRWSPNRHFPSLRRFRLYPARVLKSMWNVWTKLDGEEGDQDIMGEQAELVEMTPEEKAAAKNMRAKALILTSATISTPDASGKLNIVELSSAYGIYNKGNPCHHLHDENAVFAPKDFGHASFVFSHPQGPTPFLKKIDVPESDRDTQHDEQGDEEVTTIINTQWVDYTVKGVKAAMQQGGRVLVLTNSYRANEAIAEVLRNAHIQPIEKTRGNTTEGCRREFIAQVNGVYVTPGEWEGFDLSSHMGPDGKPVKIKHVIVTQLPFAKPDGPFKKAMKQFLMKNRGLSEKRADAIVYGMGNSAALRKFKQGFGRGIRSASDSFTFWMTDPRMPRSTVMQNALPPGPICRTQFTYAVPRRFRHAVMGGSAWQRGSALLLDGTLMTEAQAAELMEV